jgi:hypothetical protein
MCAATGVCVPEGGVALAGGVELVWGEWMAGLETRPTLDPRTHSKRYR